jgi:hypothetical protein
MKEKRADPEPLEPVDRALRPLELSSLAAFARGVWNRQGDGNTTDSVGRLWVVGIAHNPIPALYIAVGGPWNGQITVPYQAVPQDAMGITASDPVLKAVQTLDALAPLPGHDEQGSSNDVQRTEVGDRSSSNNVHRTPVR